MKAQIRTLSFLFVAIALSGAAQAALVVNESYENYTAGNVGNNTVAGNAPGISTANLIVTGTNTATIVSGTMTYAALSINGGSQYLKLTGDNTATGTLASTLSSALTPSGGSFFMSFLYRFNGTFNGGDLGYASFQSNAVNGSSTLMATGSSSNFARTYVNTTNSLSPSSAFTAGSTNFLVVEYISNGSSWTGANVWVNPTSTVLGTATYTVSGASSGTSMVAIAPLISALDPGDSADFDRLQIGASALDVIPEPSTWLLAGAAGMLFVVARRRREK